MTKIDIFSGFLGAGKTTLIKKLLTDGYDTKNIVIIENEFGQIGIDGGFLKETGIEIREMNSGCICCSLVGDFGTALGEVKKKFNPERIIIEPSGVGKLSDVVKAVSKVKDENDFVINSLVTVADAVKFEMYRDNFGEFFENQLESAKTVILSRTQLAKSDVIEHCVEEVKELNARATVITTPWDELTGKQIFDVMESDDSLIDELMKAADLCPECGHHHHDGECCHDEDDDDEHEHHHDHDEHEHHHDHDEHEHHHDHDEHDEHCHHDHEHHHHGDEVFTSWGKETSRKFTRGQLEEILKTLSVAKDGVLGTVLRAKGILPSDGEWLYFDLTPGEYEIRTGSASVTGSVCVIGCKLDKEKLAELFK